MKTRFLRPLATLLGCVFLTLQAQAYEVLVFTKTAGFRHGSIPAGIACVKKLATENGFTVVHSEDSNVFADANLKKNSVVIFLNTSGNILNDYQKAAFERFIQAGGGFVGVHAATDTEHNWPWFTRFIGA